MGRIIRLSAAAAAVAAAVLAAACSSGAGSAPVGATASAAATSAGASAVISKAQAIVDKAMQPPSVSLAGLSTVHVVPGKTIGVLVCAFSAPNCGGVQESALKAALAAAGYKAIFVDGMDTPQGQANGEEQLVSDHVNAIINISVADAVIQSAIRAARTAGIPVLCYACGNSNNPVADPQKYGSVANVDTNTVSEGLYLGAYMIVAKHGTPKAAVVSVPSALPIVGRVKGVQQAFAMCQSLGCQFYPPQPVSLDGDINVNSLNLADTFLQQHPAGQLDYIVTPSDTFGLGVQHAIATSGRKDVVMAGYDCYASDLGWIREGQYQSADVVGPLALEGWAIVDQTARVLAGQSGRNLVFPGRLITRANVGTGTSACSGSLSYQKEYEAAWAK